MNYNKKYTPATIQSERFSIPLYQRLFAWGDTQVNKLLEDLYDHYIHYKDAGSIEPYYLGQMTVVSINEQLSLIDGQQRFTVMTLLAIVLRDYTDWQHFLIDNDVMRLTFTGRNEDQQYIKSLIDGKTHEQMTYVNTRMKQAVVCIERFLKEKESDTFDKKAFAEHIYIHLTFFLAELPHSYLLNPTLLNEYFEAMNSTGKALESHEILKVNLMRDCNDQEQLTTIWNLVSRMERPLIGYDKENETIEQCREKYQEAIQFCMNGDFESALNLCVIGNDDSLGNECCQTIAEIVAKPLPPQTYRDNAESSVVSFSEFLLLVLDLTNGTIVRNSTSDYEFYKKEKLLSRFQEFPPKDIGAFYNNLLLYRLMLDFYVDRVEYIQGVGHHYLLFKDNKEDKEIHGCLKQFEAMLHVSSSDFYKWIKPLFEYIKAHNQVTSMQLLFKLKEIDNERHPLPIDINTQTYPSIDRYWFWRLDYYLWESRKMIFKECSQEESKAVDNYEFRANRSIEHLHPQDESQNTYWGKYDLNRFGNLAMISQSFNSTQSNDPVRVKFARIENQASIGDLQSIKLYHMYLKANKSPEGWNENTAEAHEENMLEILKQSYTSLSY